MSYLYPPPQPAPVIVTKDVGGLVSDYRDRTAQYRAEYREVRLRECRSACTLALSLPNVCVFPSSLLKFHQAYNADTNVTDLDISDELWRAYPQAVRSRLGTLTRQYKVIRGDELIALGIRDCDAPQQKIMIARARPSPQPQQENGTMLTSLTDRFSSLIGAPAPAPVQTKPVTEASRPPSEPPKSVPEPPPRPAELGPDARPVPDATIIPDVKTVPDAKPMPETTFGATVDVPLPPPRPPLLARAVPSEPAFRRPIPGSQQILPSRFVSLAVLLR